MLGVNPGVGAPGHGQVHRMAQHQLQGVLQAALHGGQPRLTGPPGEGGAVIGEVQAHPHRRVGLRERRAQRVLARGLRGGLGAGRGVHGGDLLTGGAATVREAGLRDCDGCGKRDCGLVRMRHGPRGPGGGASGPVAGPRWEPVIRRICSRAQVVPIRRPAGRPRRRPGRSRRPWRTRRCRTRSPQWWTCTSGSRARGTSWSPSCP
ncbi:Uncharacterised protein [Mycobacteroides abscessus subsp. abscessus]|nr:Uncharacterised protein [Mycobacteroides abscessus subsp. abscessus]